MSINYLPPRPEQLHALKLKLGYTGREMAVIACVTQQHWRRYTGGSDPKPMPYANLFHLAAQLTLEPSQIARVHDAMREIGAYVDVEQETEAIVGMPASCLVPL